MTDNQIAYRHNMELVRHNTVDEQLRHDSNREVERHNKAGEKETFRHNVEVEDETKRHNLMGEEETSHHNRATETETNRHNIATESQDAINAAETKRHNLATESTAEKDVSMKGKVANINRKSAKEVAKINAQAQKYGADSSKSANVYSANQHAAATRDAAAINAEASKYSADSHLQGTQYSADSNLKGVKLNSKAQRWIADQSTQAKASLQQSVAAADTAWANLQNAETNTKNGESQRFLNSAQRDYYRSIAALNNKNVEQADEYLKVAQRNAQAALLNAASQQERNMVQAYLGSLDSMTNSLELLK